MKRLARWFRDQTIHRKLSLIATCVILTALLPIASVMLVYEYFAVQSAAVKDIQVQSSIIRDNTAAALAFQDQAAATEVLDALRGSPSIVRATLMLPDGSPFAHYAVADMVFSAAPPLPQTEVTRITEDSIQQSSRVLLKGHFVGWLVMESCLDEPRTRIRAYALFIAAGTLFALGLAHLLARRLIASITLPLSRLATLSSDIANSENFTLREVVDSRDEIGDLSRAFNMMLAKIENRDMRLNQLAYRDNITGLTNRHYFKEHSGYAVDKALRYGSRCALMFIDLDHFKAVNDTLGHDAGDALLREVALRLSALLRNIDVICRIGGDEFAVLIEDVKDLQSVSTVAQKMIQSLAQLVQLNGHDILIGASIGISIYPDHAANAAELLRCADIAMYQAKKNGRGQYAVYDKAAEGHTGRP